MAGGTLHSESVEVGVFLSVRGQEGSNAVSSYQLVFSLIIVAETICPRSVFVELGCSAGRCTCKGSIIEHLR